jgi:hypothetical protein
VPFPGFKTLHEKGIGGFTQPFSKSILSPENNMQKGRNFRKYLSTPLHIICNTIASYPKNVE